MQLLQSPVLEQQPLYLMQEILNTNEEQVFLTTRCIARHDGHAYLLRYNLHLYPKCTQFAIWCTQQQRTCSSATAACNFQTMILLHV